MASPRHSPAPLDGLRIVSVEQAVAAPFATRHLCDLGAEVIKVERPDGGDFARRYDSAVSGTSSFFFWLNRGKKSIILDLKSEEGRTHLGQLIATADVFVQNLAPDAARRLKLTAAELSSQHPSLIVCQIRGYGADGPNAERKAYDLLIQCETGITVATGGVQDPIKVGVSIADIAAGMYAFSGILAALVERGRGYPPRSLDVSMFDSLAEWMSVPAYYATAAGRETDTLGLAHPTIAPYGPQPTLDGTVVLAVQNEREWRRLCRELLGDERLADDPRFSTNPQRVVHRAELDALIGAVTSRLNAEDLRARLDSAGIANARVRSVAEFLAHPEIVVRNRLVPVEVAGTTALALRPPVAMSGFAAEMGAVPAAGAHTDEVLAALRPDRELAAEPTCHDNVL
jgi:itaconate CoA-transferase